MSKFTGLLKPLLLCLVKVDSNDDMTGVMKGNSSIETADVADVDTSQKEHQKVLSPVDAGLEIQT